MKDIEYNEILSLRLQWLVWKKHVIQEEMAKVSGVSRQAISQYIKGDSIPNADKLAKLAVYFGVSTDYLLGLTDVKSPNMDVQAINRETGLDEDVIMKLKRHKSNRLFCKIVNRIADTIEELQAEEDPK